MDKGAELASEVGGVAHGSVPVSDDGLGNESSVVVWILPADTFDGNGNVCGGEGVVSHADFGTNKVWAGPAGSADINGAFGRLEAGEMLLGEFDEGVVGDSTSADENHAVCFVVGVDVVFKVGALDGEDVFLWPEDGAAEGLVLEGSGVEVVEYDFLDLLIDFFHLSEDDIPLSLDCFGLKFGVLEDIGKDLDSLGDIVLERASVVDSVLTLSYI